MIEKNKKTRKIYLLFIGLALLFSCNKENNKIVDKLNGTWKVEKKHYPGDTAVPEHTTTVTFEACRLKKDDKDDFCDGYVTFDYEEGVTELKVNYRVSDAGSKLWFKFNQGPTSTQHTIEFLSENELLISPSLGLQPINPNTEVENNTILIRSE